MISLTSLLFLTLRPWSNGTAILSLSIMEGPTGYYMGQLQIFGKKGDRLSGVLNFAAVFIGWRLFLS
jgi:hypothetical protein